MSSKALRPTAAPEFSLDRLQKVLARRGGAASVSGTAAGPQVIRGVTLDSRQVQPGDLYAALPGAHVHGAAFAEQAVGAGAVAVLTDPAGAALIGAPPIAAGLPAAILAVTDPRAVLGEVAAAIYGEPTRHLRLLGVTGTNGKTTVAYLLEAGLAAAGHRTGLVGTVQTRIADAVVPSVRTTPEAPELQALFATMLERGVDAAAMEVSSHALALHRVDGCRFAGAAFTNLSQDHLDFHADLEDYFEAKALLFEPKRGFLPPGRAVLSADDDHGRRLALRHAGAVTFGFSADADWRAVEVRCGPAGSDFGVLLPGADAPIRAHVAMPGSFNVSNALCAITLLAQTGTELEAAVEGVAGLAGVPGRMERIDAGQPFLALVDYAHTPAAVTSLLQTVRELVPGRLLLVLGCGGDRDRGKRPLMGAAAVVGADVAILTSDNPRSEDPLQILAEMSEGARKAAAGMSSVGEFVIEPDRAAAIALAAGHARAGDAVIVAGKGHETGQDVAGVVHPFDDREVLRGALSNAAAGA